MLTLRLMPRHIQICDWKLLWSFWLYYLQAHTTVRFFIVSFFEYWTWHNNASANSDVRPSISDLKFLLDPVRGKGDGDYVMLYALSTVPTTGALRSARRRPAPAYCLEERTLAPFLFFSLLFLSTTHVCTQKKKTRELRLKSRGNCDRFPRHASQLVLHMAPYTARAEVIMANYVENSRVSRSSCGEI
jgi:hypothetical protein